MRDNLDFTIGLAETGGVAVSLFKSWRNYWDFSGAVHSHARYVRDAAAETFLAAVRETARARITTLEKESYGWRAQLGHDWRKDCDPDGNEWHR